MNITKYLISKGYCNFEGNCSDIIEQMNDLIFITRHPNIKIAEIGFNAGHSSELFLENNKTCTVVSFDIGIHDYVHVAKEFIDQKYPKRHSLIIGKSEDTVPKYVKENPSEKFDVIFIDGGHTYENAKSDFENCYHLAHENTILIFDDLNMYGPAKVCMEACKKEKLLQTKIFYYDKKIENEKIIQNEKSMICGLYKMI